MSEDAPERPTPAEVIAAEEALETARQIPDPYERGAAIRSAVNAALELQNLAASSKPAAHHRRLNPLIQRGLDLHTQATADLHQIDQGLLLKWSDVENGLPN